ncbi:MAG TPA: aspartate kinase [Burkholderiaceae bacterium]|nr:aspartate kinase [Burkholderiaceae bacterium]
MQHTVEKIGGTSMSDYAAVRDNIVKHGGKGGNLFGRIFVVSAYGGITDMLLEHKRSGEPGVYALFAGAGDDEGNADHWEAQLDRVLSAMLAHNAKLFGDTPDRRDADLFITDRIEGIRSCLQDLRRVCTYGHFQLAEHLTTLREMLASVGEVHSAYNMAALLRRDGVPARFIDLTGWRNPTLLPLDDRLRRALSEMNLSKEVAIVTGYCQCEEGMVRTFDRGYSEMTFARLAVVSGAREAIIHKEFHLSSADPRLVGPEKVIAIGRTNYDVADQLANLGMEAIHPRAAKGLRQMGIPLRVKNTFEPEHAGTLITQDYVSARPRVEIIAGRKGVIAIEVFDQDMMGANRYDAVIVGAVHRHRARIITKDLNANTITHFLDTGLATAKRIIADLEAEFPNAEIRARKVAIVSAIGSDMKISGMLSRTVRALADVGIDILAIHQSMRQVDIQFIVEEADYETAVRSMHANVIETEQSAPVEIAA